MPVTQVPKTEKESPIRPVSKGRVPKLVAWQDFKIQVPESWDLTGFSGSLENGYLRVDDSEDQGLELKWATEPKLVRMPWQRNAKGLEKKPDLEVRLETYYRALREAAKKKKISFESKATEPPRGVLRPERTVLGFRWVGDKQAIGVIWYCATCRRVVIAQVLGARSGKGGLSANAEAVLSAMTCHGDDPNWRVWALYDLYTEIPAAYQLEKPQLMNVYLRLMFVNSTARICVEQWSLANVARKDNYLDEWIGAQSRGPIRSASYKAEESEARKHPAIALSGVLAFGQPWIQALQELSQIRFPATHFTGRAWECEENNKLYTIQMLRPRHVTEMVGAVVERTRCHTGEVER